jgi:hypothetical protein
MTLAIAASWPSRSRLRPKVWRSSLVRRARQEAGDEEGGFAEETGIEYVVKREGPRARSPAAAPGKARARRRPRAIRGMTLAPPEPHCPHPIPLSTDPCPPEPERPTPLPPTPQHPQGVPPAIDDPQPAPPSPVREPRTPAPPAVAGA